MCLYAYKYIYIHHLTLYLHLYLDMHVYVHVQRELSLGTIWRWVSVKNQQWEIQTHMKMDYYHVKTLSLDSSGLNTEGRDLAGFKSPKWEW